MKAGLAPGDAERHPVPEAIGKGRGNDLIEREAAESVESLFDPLPLPEKLRGVLEMLQGTPSAYPVKGAYGFDTLRTWRQDCHKFGFEVSFTCGSDADLHSFPREGAPDENNGSVILKGDSTHTVSQ